MAFEMTPSSVEKAFFVLNDVNWLEISNFLITVFVAFGSAYFAFKISREQETTRDLISNFFSHDSLEKRLNLHVMIEKSKIREAEKMKFSDFSVFLSERIKDDAEPSRSLFGELNPDFVHVSQFFERLIVSFEQNIINKKVVWVSLSRHIYWWNDEFYQRLIYDGQSDQRYSNAIEICQRLEKIIQQNGSRRDLLSRRQQEKAN